MTVSKMTVCDAGGKTTLAGNIVTEDSTTKNGDPFVFFAKDPTGSPHRVQIVMPLGGNESGLFRQPRIGEQVLVGQEGTDTYYLLGYIPTTEKGDNPFSPTDTGEKAEVFRYKQTGKNADSAGNEKYSEIGFYQKKTAWPASEKDKANYVVLDDNRPKIDRINIHSTGDINESAVNYHQVKANRFELLTGEAEPAASDSFKAGDLNITAGENITIKADGVITIKAGRTTLTISDDGFKVTGQLMSKLANPADASISLSALDGVSVSGKTVGITADRAWSVTDKFGAGITGTAGALSLGGREISARTAEFLGQMGSQVAYLLDATLKLTMGGMALKDTPDEESVNIAEMVMECAKTASDILFLIFKIGVLHDKFENHVGYRIKANIDARIGATSPNLSAGEREQRVNTIYEDYANPDYAGMGAPHQATRFDPSQMFFIGTYLEPYEKVASALDMILEMTELVHSSIALGFLDNTEALDKLNYAFLVIEETIISTLTSTMLLIAGGGLMGPELVGSAALALGFDGSVVIKAARNKEFYAVSQEKGATTLPLATKWASNVATTATVIGELPKVYNLITTNIERYAKEPGEETL